MATAFRRPRPKQLSVLDVLIHPLITPYPISILANSHSGAADYADRWVKCISAAPPHPSGGGLSLC